MQGAGFQSGLWRYCSLIAEKIFGSSVLDHQSRIVFPRRDRHIRRRLLQIEPLENRTLMSADGLVSYVDPSWFADYESATTLQHAGAAALSVESGSVETSDSQAEKTAHTNTCDWIVQFNTQALSGISSVGEVASLLTANGIEFQVLRGLGLVGQVLVRSSGMTAEGVTNWLTNNVNIAGFEQDSLRCLEKTSNDPGTSQLYGLNKINAASAWNLTTGSLSVVVGVIDTGIDYKHLDLAANIWTNPGEITGNGIDDDRNGFVDDVHGYDFVNNDAAPLDDNGHGTHVSGTIAAVGNNSLGVTGVNWNASLMALKFLNSSGSGYISDAIRAVNYATMMRSRYGVNLRVLNNSWGGSSYSTALASAIQASNTAGIMFVAAAGNNGRNNDASAQYPANYDYANVISVAASNQNDQLASFSCYGATTVDLAAPGVSIYSTLPNNRYGTYSGTSMATPHVSGVAALAWASKPNATVAEVRNAVLQGVDKISSLSGKVASGGRLNAYNTLQLLSLNSAPVLGSLSINPSSVVQGASATLLAQGATASAGVSAVYFYRDSNGNGAFDSSDVSLGSDTTIVNGAADLTISTSGMATGNYSYFARALDKNNQWSAPLPTTMTIVARDDYGNNSAAATLIGLNSATAGSIETGGDVDWFKFAAVPGKQYIIATKLTGLRDSVLTLYDTNGAKQLTYNDDVSSRDLSSYIKWTAPASGIYYIKVAAYDASLTGSYQLLLNKVNTAPTLHTIANQTMSYRAGALTITIPASDFDGDRLTYSATASSSAVSLRISGNQLIISPATGYIGDFNVKLSVSDGTATASNSFKVSVSNSAPVLQSIANQSVTANGGSVAVPLAASDADGDRLTYTVTATTVDPSAKKAFELDQQLGLYKLAGGYWTNLRRAGEKYLGGASGTTYFILSNGALYRWGGSIAASTLVSTFNSSYYANPSLLHNAQPIAQTALSGSNASLRILGNQLIITPAKGYTGEFTVNVTVSDGVYSSSRSFKVNVASAAPQRLCLSMDAQAGLSEDSGMARVSRISAIDVLYSLDTYWRSNPQNLSFSAPLNQIAASSYPENFHAGLSTTLPVLVNKNAFQDYHLLDGIIRSASSNDVEDALTSWENQLSEREVRENLFVLLGQKESALLLPSSALRS